ncbi:hypothetical protein [Agrococcus sp. ProA11]|uniref:hypothetical protein n=1 Tax=Agrococcus chionoecetis TaxID=3153752 RepID=UPI0032615B1D
MADAQHRAETTYAVPTAWAAVLALAIGLLTGFGIAFVIVPLSHAPATGLNFGLILGVPAAVAVVFARRTVAQGARTWTVGLVGVLAVVVVAAMLFALARLDAQLAPIGGALGTVTGIFSLTAGLWMVRRRHDRGSGLMHRRP